MSIDALSDSTVEECMPKEKVESDWQTIGRADELEIRINR